MGSAPYLHSILYLLAISGQASKMQIMAQLRSVDERDARIPMEEQARFSSDRQGGIYFYLLSLDSS